MTKGSLRKTLFWFEVPEWYASIMGENVVTGDHMSPAHRKQREY